MMRASIRQVALRAGVSPMTVSNVLRNRAGQMAEETRCRVLQAIHDLDYVPVRTAAQNRHVKTNAIGIVFLQDMQGAVGLPTFQGLCNRARQIDHDLTIFLRSDPDWVRPGSEAQFLDRRCDGFVFVGANRPEISEALVRHQIPVVECYSVCPPAGAANIVGDNAAGIRQAVQHLAAQGHERIAHIAGPAANTEAILRRESFRAAMRDLGREAYADCIVAAETWGDEWGFDKQQTSARTTPTAAAALAREVTAIVCANDLHALAVWRMAEENGLRVPQDLSITGMDNIIEGAQRGLTSIAQPFEQIGQAAIDAVMTLLNGGSAQQASRILPMKLIQRKSVAPPLDRR